MMGVLVRSGKSGEESVVHTRGRPDHVIDSVADLPPLLDRLG